MEGVTTSFPCAAQDLSLNLGFLIRGMPMESLGDGSTWMQRLRGCTKHSPAWEHPGACRGPRTRARPVPGERLRAGRGRREPTAQAAAAGGGAAEPPGEGLEPRCPGSLARTARGSHLGGFLFPRSKNASSFTGPRLQALAFPLPAQSSGQFLGSKSLLQGFQISAGRPPPPGSLTGLPQGSGGRSAPGSASVRPTSCVGLSLRMGALLPHRDSSPLSPQANAPLLPAHR